MQNKRRLYKHLMIIYVFYFVALVIGFLSTIAPSFSSGWREAQQTMDTDFTQGDVRTYYVYAPLRASGSELPPSRGSVRTPPSRWTTSGCASPCPKSTRSRTPSR